MNPFDATVLTGIFVLVAAGLVWLNIRVKKERE